MDSIFVSDRMKLKVLCPAEDTAKAFSLLDKNRQHLEAWLPWVETTTSVEHERSYVKGALERFQSGLGMEMGIYEFSTNRFDEDCWSLIGMCGIVRINRDDPQESYGDLGYWLDYDHCGQGIVTDCCTKLTDVAYTELNLEKLRIVAHEDNHSSISVANRLKFKLSDEKAGYYHSRFHDPNKLLVFVKYKND
ncbi:putative ribosomal N-acetyltransferase YdaF [Styela clava]|uniref:putative ribosomal N-acetyltransferase YdaF n=1 Tax=Styela clava TaxID=7725 RepID=UPI001939BD86|nr:putative ribosomal N-acetyltransferase YdaF [Styela clava]